MAADPTRDPIDGPQFSPASSPVAAAEVDPQPVTGPLGTVGRTTNQAPSVEPTIRHRRSNSTVRHRRCRTDYSRNVGRPDKSASAAAPVASSPATDASSLERTVFEVKRVIVGQDRLVERMLVGLLAKGHLLIEGVPGVAKTLAVETFARVVGGTLLPHPVHPRPGARPTCSAPGSTAPGREEFDTELGPVVANFVLTDEINRAPAKVQSALLEVMAERHVSIGGTTYPMPDPFLVMATQNPIENEGVYPLPEAQRDRFLFKLMVGYPEPDEEREIVYRMGVVPPVAASGAADRASWPGCSRWRPTCSCTTRWWTTWSGWSTPPARRPSTA